MANLSDIIRNIPLFSGLPREDIAKILGKLEEKSFSSGETVFSQGDQGDAFYLIQSGAVQVVLESKGVRSEGIVVLGPQDWFGEMALLSQEPRSATIVAVKDTTLWRLSREDWDELIEKHPTWLLQFCSVLSKKLTSLEQRYAVGRDAFNSLADEFYHSRPPMEQEFLRRASLLTTIDPKAIGFLLPTEGAQGILDELEKTQLPLIHPLENGGFELQGFFRDFLVEKLTTLEGKEAKASLHTQLATQYETLQTWDQAIHHFIEAQDWAGAVRLLIAHKDDLLNGSALFLKKALERMSPDFFFADLRLVHLKATASAQLGDFRGAIQGYKEVLSQRGSGISGTEVITRYRDMADVLVQKDEYAQALNCLRSALNLVEQETATGELSWNTERSENMLLPSKLISGEGSIRLTLISFVSRLYHAPLLNRWFGGILGLVVWGYLWF